MSILFSKAIRRSSALALLWACLLPPASAGAAGTQNLEELRETMEAWLRSRTAGLPGVVTVTVPPLDRHLVLPRCPRPEPFLPAGVRPWGRIQAGIRCTVGEHWSLTVPARVQVQGSAVFSARPLSRGRPITAADLETRPADLTELGAGVLTDPAGALGREVSVALAAGIPLRGDMLRNPVVVQYGQTVSVVFEENGLRVVSEGKALGNAGIGDALKVRSPSGKVLQGVVTAPGEVAIR